MKTLTELQKINKINENKTKLERLCETLLSRIDESMTFKEDTTSNSKQSIKFFMSSIETELKHLREKHINK